MDPGYRIATVLAMAAAIAACLISVPGSDSEGAEGGACGDGLVWSLDGTELSITYTGIGDGTMDDFEEEDAPWGNGITAAILGEGVRSVGACAFEGCEELTAVTLPGTVENIWREAFIGCVSLKTIDLGAANSLEYIGPSAFFASGLTEVTIPSSLTEMGSMVFSACPELASISSDNGKYPIVGGALVESGQRVVCYPMAKADRTEYAVPEDVNVIEDGAFYGAKLTSILMNDDIISIGERAFESSAVKSLAFPDSVNYFGDWCVADCIGLTEVYLSGCSAEAISYGMFDGCSNLLSIDLSHNVRLIRPDAFSDCRSLTHISFGYGLTEVEEGAFDVHVFYDQNNYTRLPAEPRYLAGNTFDGATVDRMVLQENKNPVSNIPDYMAYACILVTIIAVLGTWMHQRMRPRYRCTSFL